MQPVAPPSPDYIPSPEDPQTPPVLQDEDYMLEPVYPEYIPLEDEHVFPAKEQPLPLDDEIEDGPIEYPMDGGDDGDDDDGDSSRDDADDEDEDEDEKDEEDEEDKEDEEEHLALAKYAVVVPTDEPVSPPEGTEPASISLPPEAEVERLLAMTTPSPSPPISLSPPSARERLARCTAPPAHSSPPPVPSPLLPSSGCPTQIQSLSIQEGSLLRLEEKLLVG
ncbi:hypothetical protein Tco_0049141 [Tanacetum coccineum]